MSAAEELDTTTMSIGQAMQLALDYAERGIPAFPIALSWNDAKQHVDKVPLTEHGHKDASTDPRRIRRMFNTAHPPAGATLGAGIHLGPAGKFALDVDTKNGKRGDDQLAALEAEHGKLPDTVRTITVSGGAHIWLGRPTGVTITNAQLDDDIDVRGDNGWLVAPGVWCPWGSWEFDGSGIVDGAVVADAPAWVLERLALSAAREQIEADAEQVDTNDLPPIVQLLLNEEVAQGKRSERTYAFVCVCIETGMSDAAILGALRLFPPAKDKGHTDHHGRLAIGKARANGVKPKPRRRAPSTEFSLTDLGNARRLVREHGEDIHHVPELRRWLTWDGTRWDEDITGDVMRHAKSVAEKIIDEAREAHDNERPAIARHWLSSQNLSRLRAMVDLAGTEPSIPLRVDELDADPWMFNSATGVIDLRTGERRLARREDLMTHRGAAYEPGAKAPTWDRFLLEVFDGDEELIGFTQRSFGVALTGDVSEQYLWFPFGAGANGKSTLLNTMRRAVGTYGIQLDPRLLMFNEHHQEHPTGLTDLLGVRLATTVEVEQGRRLAESLVKQLTGGDPIRARRMHADYFEFLPTHKVWLAANHLPQINGTDHAIWRRILLVPFTQTFSDDRADPALPAKLAAEIPGILSWAVEGCLAWQRNGLRVPDRVRAATDAYRTSQDHVGRFLADCFVTDPNDYVTAADLRKAYEAWCVANGERPLTPQALGRELTSRRYDSVKQSGTKRWLGLRSTDALDLGDEP